MRTEFDDPVALVQKIWEAAENVLEHQEEPFRGLAANLLRIVVVLSNVVLRSQAEDVDLHRKLRDEESPVVAKPQLVAVQLLLVRRIGDHR